MRLSSLSEVEAGTIPTCTLIKYCFTKKVDSSNQINTSKMKLTNVKYCFESRASNWEETNEVLILVEKKWEDETNEMLILIEKTWDDENSDVSLEANTKLQSAVFSSRYSRSLIIKYSTTNMHAPRLQWHKLAMKMLRY